MTNNDRLLLWVEALESGDYQQVRDTLRSEWGFCCLGVACEVAMANGLDIDVREGDNVWFYDGQADALPTSVQDWYGLDNTNPVLKFPDGVRADCIVANDSYGDSFVSIAKAVRNTYNLGGTDE